MMRSPDFSAQFRERDDAPKQPFVYMGGTAFGCGEHPGTHKRHRWGRWNKRKFATGATGRDRMCLNCGLWSDVEWDAA